MKIFSVYQLPNKGREDVVFIPQGFSFLALIFSGLWLLYQRLWIAFAVFFVANITLGALESAGYISNAVMLVINFGISFWLALNAHEIRAWTLEHQGYRFAGTSIGRDLLESQQRFFDHRLSTI